MEAYHSVAREIKRILDCNNHSFTTIEYNTLAAMFIKATNGQRKRLTETAVKGIEKALKDMGVCAYPPVENIKAGNNFRFFRSDTVLWRIFMSYRDPNKSTDTKLAQLSSKVKEDTSLHIFVIESEKMAQY